jgi:glyoxylase-like metal-dependent hydrolase (beta-lactamase superfamily II)
VPPRQRDAAVGAGAAAGGRAADAPFFDPTLAVDAEQMVATIQKTQQADARDNIFFVFAHDGTVRGVVDMFPKTAND